MKITFTILSLLTIFSLHRLTAQDADLPLLPEPDVLLPTEVEEEPDDFTLAGMVDAYYQANLLEGEANEPLLLPTSFTDQANQFGIGMVNLLASKELGRVSFVGQVGFGPRAVAANSDSNGPKGGNFASTVQQLYVTYSPTEALTFTLGNFGTFIGYEVIDAGANMNYSTSYLFSNGPFYHTGFKADLALGEHFGAMVGIFNDTDSKFDAVSGKHYGAQLSAEVGNLAAYLNVITGKEDDGFDREDTEDDLYETQIDLTATYTLSETVALGLNTSHYWTSIDGTAAGGFFGTALYGSVALAEDKALALRAEYFGNTAAESDAGDQPSVLSFTASGNFVAGDLRIIPEFRFDTGSNGFTFGEAEDDKAAASFILAAVYTF